MSKQEKLINRFLSLPSDFTYDELRKVLNYFGYKEDTSPSGSRVRFVNSDKRVVLIHKPHPGNIVKKYMLNNVISALKEEDLL